MPYSTPAMVRMALVPSSDGSLPDPPSNTGADLSDVQILDAIAEADSLIDGYIGKYYLVPVAAILAGSDEDGSVGAIPHPIDYWSRNIAAYNTTLSYRQGLDFEDTDPVARRYTTTINALIAVSKGTVTLQIPDNNTGNAGTGAGQALNPYVGDLWGPSDFSLRPIGPAWPMWPDVPSGFGGSW
jgi:phage gp36-like protein